MTPTSSAIPSATVVPLQRPRDVLALPPRQHEPEHRGRHCGYKPGPEVHAFWDAETYGIFTERRITRHGRRCGCMGCVPTAAAEVAS